MVWCLLNQTLTAQINLATAVFHYLLRTRSADEADQTSGPRTTVEYHPKHAWWTSDENLETSWWRLLTNNETTLSSAEAFAVVNDGILPKKRR